jgi:hypothetical protein
MSCACGDGESGRGPDPSIKAVCKMANNMWHLLEVYILIVEGTKSHHVCSFIYLFIYFICLGNAQNSINLEGTMERLCHYKFRSLFIKT